MPGTPLFDKLAQMKEGDIVIFNAFLITGLDADGHDNFERATGIGGETQRFYVVFDDVELYQH